MARRTGSITSFWNNAVVGVAGTSTARMVPRGSEQLAIFVTTSAATTITLQAAHHGDLTAAGNEPDESSPPTTWFNLSYLNTPLTMTFASAGSAAMIIPDFEPAWIRLLSSAAATITAGYEITGD
jgi:hypothetical protein